MRTTWSLLAVLVGDAGHRRRLHPSGRRYGPARSAQTGRGADRRRLRHRRRLRRRPGRGGDLHRAAVRVTAPTCRPTSATSIARYIDTRPAGGDLPAADLPRRRARRLLGSGQQRPVPGRRSARRRRRRSRLSSRSCRRSRSRPAGPATTRSPIWQRGGIRRRSSTASPAASPRWTSSTCGHQLRYLFELSPLDTGTPTVYDPADDEMIDIYDNDWLSKLMASA